MLELEQVEARYDATPGAAPVLDRVSLSIAEGALAVLLGPSGCGKSTLLNLIAGFGAATRGRIRVAGRDVSGPGADRGVVFQDDALLPWLDVRRNVELPLLIKGQPAAERRERALHFLDLVGLSAHAQRATWELSGGMRQRVGIARALAADPRVLLMDEPFGALDALTRERMQELLLRIWSATGKTIVLVTHGVEEAVFLATDLVLLSPPPARPQQRLLLPFGRRYAAGEPARAIKSMPEFIAAREQVLAAVLAFEPEAAS